MDETNSKIESTKIQLSSEIKDTIIKIEITNSKLENKIESTSSQHHFLRNSLLNSLHTVSYTHLDVYKRQQLHRVHTPDTQTEKDKRQLLLDYIPIILHLIAVKAYRHSYIISRTNPVILL